MNSLQRSLEPEWMDTREEATTYDAMDHSSVNRAFATDLVAALAPILQHSDPLPTARSELARAEFAEFGMEDEANWVEIIDLGTGTAQIPVAICKIEPKIRVMAIDAAAEMLEIARYRIAAAELESRIWLDRLDVKDLPFPAEAFAASVSNSLMHHIPEPPTVFREAHRITATGGLLFHRDLMRPGSESELDRLVAEYAGEEAPLARELLANSLRAALTLDEVRDIVESLGYPAETATATSDRHWTWSSLRISG